MKCTNLRCTLLPFTHNADLATVSDVPVDLSKLANFLKWKVTTVVCFGTMVLTWLYTRLYILPVKIYWTVIASLVNTVGAAPPWHE